MPNPGMIDVIEHLIDKTGGVLRFQGVHATLPGSIYMDPSGYKHVTPQGSM